MTLKKVIELVERLLLTLLLKVLNIGLLSTANALTINPKMVDREVKNP